MVKLTFKKKPSPKPQQDTINPLNPKSFTGSKANVFNQHFDFPANQRDNFENNKVNQPGKLVPGGMLIPSGWKTKQCDFGKSQQGKSIHAFVDSKNKTNEEERNEDRKTPKHVFYKAFEIYIYAQIVKVKECFGCPLCPEELEKGEIKEEYKGIIEVHITDGIDMG